MWTPLDPSEGLPGRWLVRTADWDGGDARRFHAALDPFGQDVIVSRVDSLSALVGESLGALPMVTELLVAFASAALLMAALGLYSVASLQVSRQRQEIGIRVALGAAPGAVTRAVLKSSLVIALAGAVLGAAGAVVAAASMEPLLFGIRPADPLALLMATIGTAAMAVLAAAGPARRAARTDPLEAMRGE
jgi:ABC-type antimicrobial peptide transport system permease subunit